MEEFQQSQQYGRKARIYIGIALLAFFGMVSLSHSRIYNHIKKQDAQIETLRNLVVDLKYHALEETNDRVSTLERTLVFQGDLRHSADDRNVRGNLDTLLMYSIADESLNYNAWKSNTLLANMGCKEVSFPKGKEVAFLFTFMPEGDPRAGSTGCKVYLNDSPEILIYGIGVSGANAWRGFLRDPKATDIPRQLKF